MIKLYNRAHEFIKIIGNHKDLKIESEVATGNKTLTFTYLSKDGDITNECYVRTADDEFVVKEVEETSSLRNPDGYPEVVAVLNLEGLQGKSYQTFQFEKKRLADAARLATDGTGWTVGSCDIFKERNASMPKVTALTAIENLCTIFMAEPIYDTINHTVSFAAKRGSDKGAYFITGLNLTKLSKRSDSNGFFTRIIPIGNEGLTINEVNDGKNYLDNHSYSDKVIQFIWEDENYTDPGALMEDAQAYLKDKSKPYLSYSANVVDLAAQKPEYDILSYQLGDTVRIIDPATGTQDVQRIMKMTEYPDNPEKNECELANAYLTFEEWQEKLNAAANLMKESLQSDGRIKVSDILDWEKGVAESQSVKDILSKQQELKDNVDSFVSEVYEPAVAEMQRQLDGQIETWYYDYKPDASKPPTNGWKDTDKPKHVGDMFFDKSKGTTYRYTLEEGTYSWKQVRDEDIGNALKAASDAQDTADAKRRIFVTQPTTPYEVGDLWAQGKTGDLYRCMTGRSSGRFVQADWTLATKYTDDAALTAFINGAFADLKKQNDKKAETWYQSTDPSSAWTSTQTKTEHTGDIWYDTNNNKVKQWNGTKWQEMSITPPDAVFDRIDGKAQIFVEQPKPPYHKGDLWFQGAEYPIKVCYKDKESGNFDTNDWQKQDNYVDKGVTDPMENTLNDWAYGSSNRNEIDGASIHAKSIKAAKIDVDDLFAQNITATGTISGATLETATRLDANFDQVTKITGRGGVEFEIKYTGYDPPGQIVEHVYSQEIDQHTEDLEVIAENGKVKPEGLSYYWSQTECSIILGFRGIKVSGGNGIETSALSATSITESGTALSSKYAAKSHTHDGYAAAGHTHSQYVVLDQGCSQVNIDSIAPGIYCMNGYLCGGTKPWDKCYFILISQGQNGSSLNQIAILTYHQVPITGGIVKGRHRDFASQDWRAWMNA